ncbi:hypothetical protein D3C72_2518770 [compost metagenome]
MGRKHAVDDRLGIADGQKRTLDLGFTAGSDTAVDSFAILCSRRNVGGLVFEEAVPDPE